MELQCECIYAVIFFNLERMRIPIIMQKTPIYCPNDAGDNINATVFGLNLRKLRIQRLYLEDMRLLARFVGKKNIRFYCCECGCVFVLNLTERSQ